MRDVKFVKIEWGRKVFEDYEKEQRLRFDHRVGTAAPLLPVISNGGFDEAPYNQDSWDGGSA